jgi:hypothetical protein
VNGDALTFTFSGDAELATQVALAIVEVLDELRLACDVVANGGHVWNSSIIFAGLEGQLIGDHEEGIAE